MPKALAQRNLHLHHVMSDLTGVTGRRMLRAIVAGERAPQTLAQSRDYRIKARPATIATALAGADRSDHLCTLTPALALYDFTPRHSADGDQASERVLRTFATRLDPPTHPRPPAPPPRQPHRNEPAFALRPHLSRLTGVNLTHVPG